MGDILRKYKDEIVRSMKMIAENDKSIFIGQGVNYGGCLYGTLSDIPVDKKIELPIMEDAQMGMAIGLSLEGFIPVCIYPRMDFLILAMNQLVNHLDKIENMSKGEFKPKVIIRTLIGSKTPLDPGPQHSQDHTEMLKTCLTNVDVIKLDMSYHIYPEYMKAMQSDKSTILIEDRNLYE